MAAVGRNAPCPCGSGLKYKRCCALKSTRMPLSSRIGFALIGLILVGGAVFFLMSLDGSDDGRITPGRVWHIDHWDYPGQPH